ncbi:Tim44 domain-containing protein [Duganella sp. FT3S]|uniref:Tim44 domain-containing protein n=1 Tax=Rugamonas fusca TaxID=2758568 RepID=A0A7W2I709_9BURK|nr:Tim44-like domain-containing protein [Rugamonas fusca]MBA5605974.1 Tim44 domain-containing protein [Rugamonas fusca]
MNMKKILVGAMLAVSALSLMAEATARPMGGGRSFGRQSQSVSRMAPAPAPAPTAPRQAATPAPAPVAPPAALPPKPASPWKGIVGGALLGLGMGALMSHFGMGGGMFGSLLTVLMLGALAFLIIRMLRGLSGGAKPAPATVYSGNFGANAGGNFGGQGNVATPEIGARLQPATFEAQPATAAAQAAPHAPWGVPADFDTATFLRVAKGNFIRLQAAWDKGDVADIREFTTPEVFAELKMQITERGAQADFTDVVSIEAELLGIETSDQDYLASVKFTGMIRSAPGAAAEPFHEVWNLAKPVNGSMGWLLAGIQQLA